MVDVEFIDSSGSIKGLRLFDGIAVALIGHKANDFKALSEREQQLVQEQLRWKLCKVYFQVRPFLF